MAIERDVAKNLEGLEHEIEDMRSPPVEEKDYWSARAKIDRQARLWGEKSLEQHFSTSPSTTTF